jgi:hypothetical protein
MYTRNSGDQLPRAAITAAADDTPLLIAVGTLLPLPTILLALTAVVAAYMQANHNLIVVTLLAAAAHLWREVSSSPLIGSLPPSNTTSGSTPLLRSI